MQSMNIVGHRKWYYLFSAAVLIPGMVALLVWGLPLGIDFTGGSLLELRTSRDVSAQEVRDALTEIGFGDSTVQLADDNTVVIKTRTLESGAASEAAPADQADQTETPAPGDVVLGSEAETTQAEDAAPDASAAEGEPVDLVAEDPIVAEAEPAEPQAAPTGERAEILSHLSDRLGTVEEVGFESIGPTVSRELTWQAINSVVIASLAIILYIAWAFRSVPKPTSSFRFGVTAIIALVHDILFLLGAFAILGRFMSLEVDAMFVVAALTIMGFSVHDSIVVFDRIREKLRSDMGQPMEHIVNHSILETLGRSINTSFTVLLVLLAMLLFGGESIRDFNLALLIGITIGSYSSIFVAAPFLVDWQRWADARARRQTPVRP
jgi:preprotein translocase subunit SecF